MAIRLQSSPTAWSLEKFCNLQSSHCFSWSAFEKEQVGNAWSLRLVRLLRYCSNNHKLHRFTSLHLACMHKLWRRKFIFVHSIKSGTAPPALQSRSKCVLCAYYVVVIVVVVLCGTYVIIFGWTFSGHSDPKNGQNNHLLKHTHTHTRSMVKLSRILPDGSWQMVIA